MENEATMVTDQGLVTRYDELRRMVAGMEDDFAKFYGQGNKAAGTRVRAAMQQLKTFAQTVRTEVQEIKNDGKSEPPPPMAT